MNDIIGRLMENGLIIKWIREQFYGSLSRTSSERKYYAKNFGLPHSDRKTIVITIGHISGALYMLCIGYATATVVFFIELCIRLKGKVFQQKLHADIRQQKRLQK